ncbi:DNA methyltransferase [Streptomyces parvulus]|uniref:DNA methyltransferase n=1 Tax=Streptomyces parvulus TaxID=146923 RepID=UPI00369DE1AC
MDVRAEGQEAQHVQEPIPGEADPDVPGRLVRGALTPKRPATETAGMADAFPYYAGFSFEWARGKISEHHLPSDAVVLDPWNGSGTTTLAANSLGIRSIGIDRNPVANTVARLRCSGDPNTPPILTPISSRTHSGSEPLESWFNPQTAVRFREWAQTFSAELAPNAGIVALFRVVRATTKSFEGSNPTWVKRAKSDAERVDIGRAKLDELIVREQRFLSERLSSVSRTAAPNGILTADSACLPIADQSVDLVLTSPPYLTRIDYAIAYARELAVLGIDIFAEKDLRYALMGTTLTRTQQPALSLGSVATELLAKVASHGSKASSGYYLKQVQQYLRDFSSGMDEISRVVKPSAEMHLVVQDSYYKDIPVPLAQMCIEEAERRSWRFVKSKPYAVRRLLTSLNRSAQAYKKGEVSETVITFRRIQ